MMRNRDMPAGVAHREEQGPDGHYYAHVDPGLTKRELAAMAAMQGLLANPALVLEGVTVNEAVESFAITAAWAAEALFNELERPND